MREEAKFDDELQEQANSIEELNKKIETAKKDTSISGQKKLQDLIKQLEEEQKKFEETTQDKIDQNINDEYEDEQKRLEEESKDRIEALEEQWSDSKIAEMVKEALGTGMFTDINGEVSSLQDKMLEFAEQSGDAVGAMADVIKNDLISSLNIALDTFKELDDINNKLNLKEFAIVNPNNSSANPSRNQISKSVTFGETNIYIQGNSNEDILEQVDSLIDKKTKEFAKNLTRGL